VSYLTIKNIRIEPGDAPNDGSAAVSLGCTVFTATEHAGIRSVEIDLSSLGGSERQELRLHADERLPSTGEGRYEGDFPVPLLADPGKYELTILARDTEGFTNRAKATLEVKYRRPVYDAPIGSPAGRRILAQVGRAPIVPGNRVEVLADGKRALDRRLEAVAAATRQINLQTYVFSLEGAGARFYETLLARLQAGVETNIILNADTQIPAALLSTLRLSFQRLLTEIADFFEMRRAAGGEKEFSSFEARLAEWKRSVQLILLNGSRLRERGLVPVRHGERPAVWLQKLVDDAMGERSYEERTAWDEWWQSMYQGPGGLPAIPLLDYAAHEKILVVDGTTAIVGGRNLADEYFTHWLDVDVCFEGPAVGHVQQGLARSFHEFQDPNAKPIAPVVPDGPPRDLGEAAVQFVQSRPWVREHDTLKTLATAFQMARSRIFAYSQYLVLPNSLLLDALVDAARRGVDVRILTNSQLSAQDLHLGAAYYISLNYFARLLNAGIRVFLLNGHTQPKTPQPYLHVKEFLIDGELACFGSVNLSLRSCFVESENLVNVFDPAVVAAEEQLFADRCAHHATEVTPAFMQEQYRLHRGRMEIARSLELLF
jgi:phosphatidylserine/phosphatidylglycerophosphate/cardiolipin synthase-like enzyme